MGIIEDPKQLQQARELAAKRGLSIDEAVSVALSEALARSEKTETPQKKATLSELKAIAESYHALPVFDNRSMDEMLGYNEHGTFD